MKTDEHKTDEAADAAEATEATEAPESIDVTKAAEAPEAAGTDTPEDADASTDEDTDEGPDGTGTAGTGAAPTGVGQGAGAVVSAGLGIVSLTGSWVGTVASARESLMGQLQTSSSSDVGTLIEKGYGNAWQATAMWGGIFALVALIVGVVVLARPAFGAPGRPQAPWIKSVAWAGVALGVIGLLLAVLKYTDVLLGLPATG
ncbi:integral membrane protein [Streptomyces lividans TK24]|nr:integral membrane protein [Streptomyces lividans TK24]